MAEKDVVDRVRGAVPFFVFFLLFFSGPAMHQTTVSKPLVPLQYRRHTAIMGELHICPAAPVNSRQVTIKTPRGEYLIQVSWPLCWGPDGRPKTPVKDGDIPIMYSSPLPLAILHQSTGNSSTDLKSCVF